MIVLDTNVLSETLRPTPSAKVLRWLRDRPPAAVYITSITQTELLIGLELMPKGRRRTNLESATEKILAYGFPGRILPFEENAARSYSKVVAARDSIGRPISRSDAMIAAIARSRNASVATRNVRDFEHCGVNVIDPWSG
jgi:predicted nucleic acid-binding protein